MKKQKFKEANSECKCVYINNTHNVIMMKFRPTFKELFMMNISYFFPCVSVWVGAPIRADAGKGRFTAVVRKSGFVKGDTDE